MWLISCAVVCPVFTQLEAQTVEQLRDDVNRDAHLQALQQAWDSYDLVRTQRLLKALEPEAGKPDRRSFPWYRYNYLANEAEVIRGVQSGFGRVAISPDDKTMLALGNEQVDIWDLGNPEKIASLSNEHTDLARFSSDSRLVALCSHTSSVSLKRSDVYDLKSHERVASFPGADYATFSPDRTLLAVVKEATVEFRSTTDWQLVRQLDGQGAKFDSIEFSRDGLYFAATGRDTQVRVWRVSDGAQQFSLSLHVPEQIAFLDNPSRLLVVERGRGVRAWSVPDGAELSMFQGQPHAGGGGGAMFISHDQKFLVTAVPYANVDWVEIWDLVSGRLLRKLELGEVQFDLCLLGKSNRLAIATDQGQLVIWNLETLKREASFVVEREPRVTLGRGLNSDTDGKLYWAADENVSIFPTSTDETVKAKPIDAAPSGHSSSMLWCAAEGLDVGDFASRAVRHIDVLGPANLISATLSLDGQKAAAGIGQGKVAVWSDLAQPPFVIDLALEQPDQPYQPNEARLKASYPYDRTDKLALSPSAKYMAAEGHNQPLQVWNLETRTLVKILASKSPRLTLELAVSDKPSVATVTQSEPYARAVELWKINADEPSRLLTDLFTSGCLFSPDSQWLLTTGGQAYKIWSCNDGKVLAEHKISNPRLEHIRKAGLAFVPGKNSLIVAEDEILQEIDPLSGARLKSFSPSYWTDENWNLIGAFKQLRNRGSIEDHLLMSISVSGDGQRVAAQNGGGKIFQWNMADSRGTQLVERPRPAQAISQDKTGQKLIAAETNIVSTSFGSDQWKPAASLQAPQAAWYVARSGDLLVAACKRPSQHLQTFSSDNETGLWSVTTLNVSTGKQVSQFDFALGIQAIAISPDQKLLAIGSREMEREWQKIYLCRTDTGEVLAKLDGRVGDLHFSADGQQLIGAIEGDHPLVMPATALSEQLWNKPFSAMTTAGPNSRQKLLAFGMQNGEIEIWDYGTGKHLQSLLGHPGEIATLEFTPDGHYLASGGSDNCVRLWSLATGLQVWSYSTDKPIQQLQFDDSGQNLGIRTADNEFQVLRGKP